MKASRYAIIFIFIISPFLLMNYINTRKDIAISFQEVHYTNVLNLAIEAATFELYKDSEVDMNGRILLNKEAAIDAFFETLYLNFNILDVYEQETLKTYVPLLLFIDYDGVYTYSPELYTGGSGELEKRHILHNKKYFTLIDNGQIITTSIGDYYTIDDLTKNITFEGTYDEIRHINASPFFTKPKSEVEQIKKTLMTSIIENELRRINDHNAYAKQSGINYDFYIPDTTGDMSTRTIDSVGIMATIQGLPIGHKRFNMFSFAGSGIMRETKVQAYNDGGILLYHEEGCSSMTGTLEEIYDNAKEAAISGYSPHYDCN